MMTKFLEEEILDEYLDVYRSYFGNPYIWQTNGQIGLRVNYVPTYENDDPWPNCRVTAEVCIKGEPYVQIFYREHYHFGSRPVGFKVLLTNPEGIKKFQTELKKIFKVHTEKPSG